MAMSEKKQMKRQLFVRADRPLEVRPGELPKGDRGRKKAAGRHGGVHDVL